MRRLASGRRIYELSIRAAPPARRYERPFAAALATDVAARADGLTADQYGLLDHAAGATGLVLVERLHQHRIAHVAAGGDAGRRRAGKEGAADGCGFGHVADPRRRHDGRRA